MGFSLVFLSFYNVYNEDVLLHKFGKSIHRNLNLLYLSCLLVIFIVLTDCVCVCKRLQLWSTSIKTALFWSLMVGRRWVRESTPKCNRYCDKAAKCPLASTSLKPTLSVNYISIYCPLFHPVVSKMQTLTDVFEYEHVIYANTITCDGFDWSFLSLW